MDLQEDSQCNLSFFGITYKFKPLFNKYLYYYSAHKFNANISVKQKRHFKLSLKCLPKPKLMIY